VCRAERTNAATADLISIRWELQADRPKQSAALIILYFTAAIAENLLLHSVLFGAHLIGTI
jgi:hypothetical protein